MIRESKNPHYLTFFPSSLQYPLLDGSLANQAINSDLFCLPKTVRSIHCLLINRRVPVGVVKNNLPKLKINCAVLMSDRINAMPQTVSAAVKLMPNPPARVESKNTKMSVLLWKSATMSRLAEILLDPSSRMYRCFRCHMYS